MHMRHSSTHLRRAWLVLPFFLLGSGCGDQLTQRATAFALEKAVEQKTGVDADMSLDGDLISYTDANGNAIHYGQTETLPDDLAAIIPVPTNATITSLVSANGETYLSLQSTDQAQHVLTWYETELAAWSRTGSIDTFDVKSRTYEKDNLRLVISIIGQDADPATANIRLSPK